MSDIEGNEIIEGRALVKAETVQLAPPQGQTIEALEYSFKLAVRQRELLEEFVKKRFKSNIHYGKFGALTKDTLLLPGAELICMAHGFAPDFEKIAGPDQPQPEFYQITIRCVLRGKGDSLLKGVGHGSAGSHVYSKKQGREILRGADREHTYNTTLKMAEKRAYVDAILKTTAASEFYTQDMEDAEPPPVEEQGANRKERVQPKKEDRSGIWRNAAKLGWPERGLRIWIRRNYGSEHVSDLDDDKFVALKAALNNWAKNPDTFKGMLEHLMEEEPISGEVEAEDQGRLI